MRALRAPIPRQAASDPIPTPARRVPVREVLREPGRPLQRGVRSRLEEAFDRSLADVRVHTGPAAGRTARALGASAWTLGAHVAFAPGRYVPGTRRGDELLAHELTHVVQQGEEGRRAAATGGDIRVAPSGSRGESEAKAMAGRVWGGVDPPTPISPGPAEVQRNDDEAPIESEREVRPRATLRPDLFELTLEVLEGRHRIEIEGGTTQPLNLLGRTLPGIPPSRLSAALRYENRCNEAFQGAVVDFEQRQRAGGPLLDLGENPWEVGARLRFRSGSVLFEPGGRLGFEGSTFDSALFTLTITRGVSTRIPTECITPQREPEAPAPEPEQEPGLGPRTDEPGTPASEPPTGPTEPVRLSPVMLNFFYDSHLLRPESHDPFQRVTSILSEIPRLQVHLVGHTSLEGSEEYNLRLGQRRADAIRDRLVLAGVDRSRIRTFSLGEAVPAEPEPAVSGRSLLPAVEEVRTRNRRVEVIFLDPRGEVASSTPPTTLRTPGPLGSGSERP